MFFRWFLGKGVKMGNGERGDCYADLKESALVDEVFQLQDCGYGESGGVAYFTFGQEMRVRRLVADVGVEGAFVLGVELVMGLVRQAQAAVEMRRACQEIVNFFADHGADYGALACTKANVHDLQEYLLQRISRYVLPVERLVATAVVCEHAWGQWHYRNHEGQAFRACGLCGKEETRLPV